MARIPHETFTCAAGCTVEATLNLIGGKWKGVILYRLLTEQVLRFNELRRLLPNITQRMLTNQLRELEGDGLIARKVYPEAAQGGIPIDGLRPDLEAGDSSAEEVGRCACRGKRTEGQDRNRMTQRTRERSVRLSRPSGREVRCWR